MGRPAALSTADLRLWLVGDAQTERALGSACSVEPLMAGAWREHAVSGEVDFLLVQVGERLDDGWAEELPELLDVCERAGTPRVLWVTGSPFDRRCLGLVSRFDRVLAVDPRHLPQLGEAGGATPTVLPLATHMPIDDRAVGRTGERPYSVVWLGGWRPEWPQAWRDCLAGILDAALPHGLRVVALGDTATLPAELRGVVKALDGRELGEVLHAARVVIGADATCGSRHVVPGVVFDAVACGAAVISPHDAGMAGTGLWFTPPPDRPAAAGMRRRLVSVVTDRDGAAAELARLLGDDAAREETVHHARRVVTYNHTYANRVATLASTVGLRVVPDATARPAPG